jgi:hypothetical protein
VHSVDASSFICSCGTRTDIHFSYSNKSVTDCDGELETEPRTCEDGTLIAVGEGCPGDGSEGDEGESDDEGREEIEEEDSNCGGESCTDDEKEDSTTDEDETDEVPLG